MKILLIMDPYIPVPPPSYGGHERLVAMFAEEYERQGHQVTLLAGPGSKWPRLVTFGKTNLNLNTGKIQRIKEVVFVWKTLLEIGSDFDLIHNFGRLIYLMPVLNKAVKKIMTYGRDVTGHAIKKINLLPTRNLIFTACSNYCVNTGNTAGHWETVYNAIDFRKYNLTQNLDPDSPLMFLGRIEEIKGAHHAIRIARETHNKLWLAGNIAQEHQLFFDQEIKPYLNDDIVYLGPLNDEQKDIYLGKSKALVFPIEWDEPFGMVMVEAMSCGTPVAALKRGSVVEVVDENVTGKIFDSVDELISRLEEVLNLDREKCRLKAKERFDTNVIASKYLTLFEDDKKTDSRIHKN